MPKQKIKKSVTKVVVIEEEEVKSCFCFRRKKKSNETDTHDNSVTALEEGTLGRASLSPSRRGRNSPMRTPTRAHTARSAKKSPAINGALKTSPKRSIRKAGKVSPR